MAWISSPVFCTKILQIRGGRKPDGVCLVVGTCARGYKNNSTSDVIYCSSSVKPVGNSKAQFFWEVIFYTLYYAYNSVMWLFRMILLSEKLTGISSWFRSHGSYYLHVHLCRTPANSPQTWRIARGVLEFNARISG